MRRSARGGHRCPGLRRAGLRPDHGVGERKWGALTRPPEQPQSLDTMPPCSTRTRHPGSSPDEDHQHPAGPDAAAPRPAVPPGLGPGAAPPLRRHPGHGGDRRGCHRVRLGRHDGRLRAVRAPVHRPRPAVHRRARQDHRVDRLPRRPVLAAGGGAVGHHRAGDRAAGQRPVRRGQPRAARLRLVRRGPEPAGAGRGGRGGKGRRLSGHEAPDIPNGLGFQPRRPTRHPGGGRRRDCPHGRPEPVVADGRRCLARARRDPGAPDRRRTRRPRRVLAGGAAARR